MSITAPFDPRALTDLAQTLETTCVVTATTASGVPIEKLDVSSLVLTLDEAWAPHAQAELSFTSAAADALDARLGVGLTIDVGYRYPAGPLDQHRIANLQLTDVTGTSPFDDNHAIAHSDELRLIRHVPIDYSHTYPVGTSIVNIIEAQLSIALGKLPEVTAWRGATIAEPLTITPATELWDLIKSLSEQANVWTYADALGTWRVTVRPESTGRSVVQITERAAGITTTSEWGVTRDGWGNAVVMEFGDGQVAFAHEPDGLMGTATVGVTAVRTRTTAPWPGSIAAAAAARAHLRLVMTRGASKGLTALAAFWLRPGDTITTPEIERVIVSRVRFTWPDSLMTITTRKA